MRNLVTTALLNSTTLTEGFGGWIRPTELERRVGRLMRSPDHDAGTADAGAATAAGDDAGASGDDTGGATSGADAGAGGGEGDDATVLGAATADDGAGDDKGGEGKEGDGAAAKPDDAGVPETYELKAFKVGEGDDAKEVEIDSALLDNITPGLKEAGVSQDQLDKLAPLVPAIQNAALEAMNGEFAKTRADWAKAAQNDPEIGGKNWNETVRLAALALDRFGAKSEIKEIDGKKVETNEFRKLLNDSGLGNHPVMLKMFRDIGAATAEDGTLIRNTTATKENVAREARNYPEDQPKS